MKHLHDGINDAEGTEDGAVDSDGAVLVVGDIVGLRVHDPISTEYVSEKLPPS